MQPVLDYANVTGRPTSRFVRIASALSRGVASVQRQHEPYARAWHEANVAALNRSGPRWIVFGDSMSLGIGASSFDAGWVDEVSRRLDAAGTERPILNLAASGARVADVLEQQLPAWRALPPAAGAGGEPDLVTVLVGSNDLMSRAHRNALSANFAELVRQLPPRALVATLPQPRAAARAANVVLETAAARGEIRIVDMRTSGPTSWRGRLAADHFHPNNRGYAAIADAFIGEIRSELGAAE